MKPLPTDNLTVAAYLTEHVEKSDMTLSEIARKAGFPRVGIIKMMCAGEAKVPIKKVYRLSIALRMDPIDFLGRVMAEYSPDTLLALRSFYDNEELQRIPAAFVSIIISLAAHDRFKKK